MNITTTKITPERAKQLLSKNVSNRPLNENHVKRLADDMMNGNWKFNGDTICMNGQRLIDGQHRLSAIVKSGVTIEAIIVDGLPSDVFDTKDVGKRRSGADTLSVKGEKNCAALAAALAVIYKYENGLSWKGSVENIELEKTLQRHPDVRNFIKSEKKMRQMMSASIVNACEYLFSLKDATLAKIFVDSLVNGEGITKEDPVYLLRERMLQNHVSRAKLPNYFILAITIKAWNATRRGDRIKCLKFIEGEPFPEIQ